MLELAGHLLDFGMCVLLWLVQLIIYPSFLRVREDALVAWHRVYTFRLSLIVIPLMIGQLALVLYASIQTPTLASLIGLGLLLVCWMLTFFVSVPLHHKVQAGEGTQDVLNRLVQTNWPRTILWTLVLVVGFL